VIYFAKTEYFDIKTTT